jgi:hypothetical protein
MIFDLKKILFITYWQNYKNKSFDLLVQSFKINFRLLVLILSYTPYLHQKKFNFF